MSPLILSGHATAIEGRAAGKARRVLRLNAPDVIPADYDPIHDAALSKSESETRQAIAVGFGTIVTSEDIAHADAADCAIQVGKSFDYLAFGDVIGVHTSSRRMRSLYRKSERHVTMLITERCNNYCLMCSQPPKDIDDGWILQEVAATLRLIDPSTTTITFTGGEPLTDTDDFLGLIEIAKAALPETRIQVLTNGRAFADPEVAKAWAAIKHPNLSAAIPVYSAVDHLHDYVVQAKGAFDETILGILRLKNLGQHVQIRMVLHALTIPRLKETAEWFARNLPYVDHVALMGLENTGFAIANDKELWIDPIDYQAELAHAVTVLRSAKVNVSVFNLPLCVLAPEVRPYAVQSISDWKNSYVEACDQCTLRADCAGFFSSGRPKFSRGIVPFQ